MALRPTKIAQKSEQTADPQIGRIQNYLSAAATTLNAVNFIPGRLLGPLTFTAGQTRVLDHGLSRSPVGFMVLDAQTSPAQLTRGTTNENTVAITSASAGTYTVWVF